MQIDGKNWINQR